MSSVRAATVAALLAAALWAYACTSAPPPESPAEGAAEAGAPPPDPGLAIPEPPLPLPGEAEPPVPGAAAETPDPPAYRPAHVEDGHLLVRVGLASDLLRLELPCCEGEVTIAVEGEEVVLRTPLVVEPAASAVAVPEYRLQVAALRDEGQAKALASDLAGRTGWPGDVRFDAASGLYRVRLGRFPTEDEARAGRRHVQGLGFGGAWPVQEGGGIEAPALRVRSGNRSFRVDGRWLVVRPGSGQAWEGSLPVSTYQRSGRFRGRLLVFLNARGSLNLVNELPLEQYLRGVVPKELGPALYPRIEALKAQAVAARTYTLRHLGEFADEGFDLCAEPRCQVYGGLDAEHPLSDRAVAETASEVLLFGDEIVEALYSATCGGHTEDAPVVFPWLDAPYLRGVPCPEGEAARLAGVVPTGTPFPEGMIGRLVPVPQSAPPRAALQERLESLARTAGLPPTGDRLGSMERNEVRRYVRSVFDLVLDPSLLLEPVGASDRALPAAVEAGTRPVCGTPVRPVASEPVSEREADWLVLGLARILGLVNEEAVRFRSLDGGALVVAGSSGGVDAVPTLRRLELPGDLATFAHGAAGEPTAAELALLPGDALRVYRWRGRLAAVVREGAAGAPPPDTHPARASRFRTWTRFRSDRQLAGLVAERYPGLGFRGLEVLERGVSGRVARLRLLGEGGRTEIVEGLAVRWTLDLPDTRFEARAGRGSGGESGWWFTGGGWGHGVGMCQIGAYVLAGRDLGYHDILEHYYSGVRLGRALVR